MLLLATSLMGSESVNWAKNYDEALSLAKKENKPVYILISSNRCKYCREFKRTTLQDDTVIKALNKDFISLNVKLDKKDYLPEKLYTPGLPGMWFLLPNGTPMFQPIMGKPETYQFIQALGIVKTTFDTQSKAKKTK
jgi:uncharacterized protein YyaL (SSP411 family)